MHTDGNRITVSLIVASGSNGAIGKDGAMPWHLPGDLRYFKRVTMGKPVIMGQKTWESLKYKPLPGRANIVLTRRRGFQAAGARVSHALEAALAAAKQQAAADGQNEIFVIGGGEVFRQAFPLADRLYWTEILGSIDGDVFFKPALPRKIWDKKPVSAPAKQAGDSHDYRFWRYEKCVSARETLPKNAKGSRRPDSGNAVFAFFRKVKLFAAR